MKKYLPNFKIIPLWAWLFMAITSLLFVLFPQIDIMTSALFYDKATGFVSSDNLIVYFFYHSIKYILIFTYLFLLGLWLYNKKTANHILDFDGKKFLYLFLVLAIGSGLIVNATLKEHWGRARPHHIVQFGGTKTFTPAFVISDQNDNSFSSGHASAAFVFIAFALLAKRRRKMWMSLALLYGISVGLVRIVVGGHFLSDTIVSFYIMYIVSMLLYERFFLNNTQDDKSISQI